MDNTEKKLRIAIFPWLAFGHMIPYFNLAKLIAKKGHSVSFLSTTKNIERLPKIPPNLASQITFIKLKLPHTLGLPEGAEATSDLSIDDVPYLKASFDRLEPQIAEFLQSSSSPDWLVSDFALFWVGQLASKLGIANVFLSIFIASCLAYLGPPEEILLDDEGRRRDQDYSDQQLIDHDHRSVENAMIVGTPKWIPFETNVVPPYFGSMKCEEHFENNFSGASDMYRLATVVKNCDVVAIRSSYEIEPEALKVLEDIYKKPVLPVGQLPPNTTTTNKDGKVLSTNHQFIINWLDGKPSKSVIYVAFGSEATISKQDLTELALGLEISGMPFLWVLKKAQEAELPQTFKQRIEESGNGLVCTAWVPQLKILGHDSVGGFLSHSGWSSVVEAISFQKPLILLPMQLDQFFNSKLMEGKKLGYIIPREERDGSFSRISVADSLKLVVMNNEGGKVLRETVKEMSSLFTDQIKQNLYIDPFIEYLITHRKKQ